MAAGEGDPATDATEGGADRTVRDGADDHERDAGGQGKRSFSYAIVRTHNACRVP